ncbi:MAG: hypothetical protein ACI4RP_06490 [Acutalibacteraceae bacterium]
MLEPMNALDRLSRANTPHPSASPPPSPKGEGLTRFECFLISEQRSCDYQNYYLFFILSSLFSTAAKSPESKNGAVKKQP